MQQGSAVRILAVAVLAAIMLVPALSGVGTSPLVPSTRPVSEPAGAVSAAALPTTPQLLGFVNRTDIGLRASSVNTTWRIVMAEDSNGFAWDVGNAIGHPNGDTSTIKFTQANDHDYPNVTALLTNGIDDPIEFVSGDKLAGGPYNFTENNESVFFPTHPDFIGNEIDYIQLIVHDLHLVQVTNTTAVEFANYTWQVWGHPGFIAFAPPADADESYLFDRNYTNVSVSLASNGTAVSLLWDGVNRSMQGGGRTWYANVTDIPNGGHAYQVWADDNLSNVYHSDLRQLTVAFHYWSVEKLGQGSGPGLATDSGGKAHLCFADPSGGVHYATNTSTGWSVQTIASGGTGFCAIALDHEGRPNVLFGALTYGILNGSSWHFDSLSSAIPTKGAAIAINPVADQPVVAFYDSEPSQHYLVLKNRTTSGTWTTSVVDRNGDTGWMPSLVVNATGIAQLAYTDSLGDIWHTTVSGGKWDANLVARGPVLPGQGRISIALDSSGKPHIAYAGGGPRYGTVGYIGLRYASVNGTTWSSEGVYPGPTQALSLVIDRLNHPHIAFSLVGTPPPTSGVLRDLRYASWNGTWDVAVLSHSVNSTGVALGLAPSGIPQIAATSWCCGNGASEGILEYFTVNVGLFATFDVTPSTGNTSTVFAFDPRTSYDTYFPASSLQVRWDFSGNGTWTAWGPLAVIQHTYSSGGTYTVYAQVRDPGNVSAMDQRTLIVDGQPPVTVATLSGTNGSAGWFRSAVVIALTVTDDLTRVVSTSYSLDGGPWTSYGSPITVAANGNHTIRFTSTDAVGNAEPVKTVAFGIDLAAPVTTAALSGTAGQAGWYVSSVLVTLGGSDSMSGVASIHERTDGGAWQTYSAPFVLGDGSHTVQYFSIDRAGNQGATGTSGVNVDTTPPTVLAQFSGTPGSVGWYTSPVGVSFQATDSGSGVASISVRTNGGPWQNYISSNALQNVTTDGVYSLTYFATDLAGNAGPSQTLSFKIDQLAPGVGVRVTGTPGNNGWFSSSVTVTLNATDDASGVASLSYRIDGGSWQAYSGPFPLGEGNHTVDYVATDVAGNAAAVQSSAVKVDTTPPVLDHLVPSGPVTTPEVTVSWSGSDAVSGIADYRYSVDGGPFHLVGKATSATIAVADGDHTIVVAAFDVAGNSAQATTQIHVDTNVFSFFGPYAGVPLVALLALAVIALLLVVFYWRRRKKEERTQQQEHEPGQRT